ncbi:hypothetical protein CEXT_589891 [Caerostris extrusa]|uniref:Uncharacterized protein n=1 Tax=Caerostris extrusa TaxID=172846 RepID=A0AAV4QHC2_CAEEX|nr:hypothetical protein CEXT_589891 [Caerostris extrusa]
MFEGFFLGILSETLMNGSSLEVRESTAPHPYSVLNMMPGGKCVLSFKGDSVMCAIFSEEFGSQGFLVEVHAVSVLCSPNGGLTMINGTGFMKVAS